MSEIPEDVRELLEPLFKKMALVSDEAIEHMHPSIRNLAKGIKIDIIEKNQRAA